MIWRKILRAAGGLGGGMFGWLRREPERVVHEAPQPMAVAAREPTPEPIEPTRRRISKKGYETSSGEFAVPPGMYQEDLPESLKVMQHYKRSSKKWLTAAEIARGVVKYLREHDLCSYPHLSQDLDEVVIFWCEKNNVEPMTPKVVKEEMVMLDGVHRSRQRLKDHNRAHRYIMQRLRTAESTNDRPVLYYVLSYDPAENPQTDCDLSWLDQDVPAPHVHALPGKRKAKGRPGRSSGGKPPSRNRPFIEDDSEDFVIGEEMMPKRRYA